MAASQTQIELLSQIISQQTLSAVKQLTKASSSDSQRERRLFNAALKLVPASEFLAACHLWKALHEQSSSQRVLEAYNYNIKNSHAQLQFPPVAAFQLRPGESVTIYSETGHCAHCVVAMKPYLIMATGNRPNELRSLFAVLKPDRFDRCVLHERKETPGIFDLILKRASHDSTSTDRKA